jgi:hypothetical protein
MFYIFVTLFKLRKFISLPFGLGLVMTNVINMINNMLIKETNLNQFQFRHS